MTVLFFVPKKSSTNLGPIEYVYGRSSFVCGEKDKILGTSESHLGLVVTRDLKKGKKRIILPVVYVTFYIYNILRSVIHTIIYVISLCRTFYLL